MTEYGKKLFERFKTKEGPHYLSEEDIAKIPMNELRNRINLLQLLEIRLSHIAYIIDMCKVLTSEKDGEEYMDTLVVPDSFGLDSVGCKRDENGCFDKRAVDALCASHLYATRELNDLLRGFMDYRYGILDEEYVRRMHTKHKYPFRTELMYEYDEGKFNENYGLYMPPKINKKKE